MPNFAYKIKTIKQSDLETVYVYKLEPKTVKGTEYISIKVKRIENKFFREKDFLDVYYAPSSKTGDAISDFKLFEKIESDNSGLSGADLVRRYPGIGSAKSIKDTFEEYSEKYKSEPLMFDKILKHFQQSLKTALPDDRDGLNSMVEIMRSISGREPGSVGGIPRQENPDLQSAISNFFKRIEGPDGRGYTISTQKPPRKLELESVKKLIAFTSRLIKENTKYMYHIREAEEEKKKRRPLEIGDASPVEMGEKPKPDILNRFRNLDLDDGKIQSEQPETEKEIELDPRAHSPSARSSMERNKEFKVLYAGDREGNPTTVDRCYFCILQFRPEIELGHLSSQESVMRYEYVLYVNGRVKEYAPIQGTDPEQEDLRPLFPVPQDASSKAWRYMAKNHQDTASDLLSLMKRWGGNFPTNKFQHSANSGNAPFVKTEWNEKNPLKPKKTKVTFTNALEMIKKLTMPAKDGGLGAGSYLISTSKKSASEYFALTNIDKYRSQYSFLKQEIDHISKQIKNFGGEKDPDAARFVKARDNRKNELEELIKKAANEKISEEDLSKPKKKEEKDIPQYQWVDLGLKLVPSAFTKNVIGGSGEKRPKIDIRPAEEIQTSPKPEAADIEDFTV